MPGSAINLTTSPRNERFTATHWSVVLAARGGDSASASEAMEALCRVYWYPLYTFVRRLGLSPHDAEDSVQGFFAQCLEKDYLAAADESKGRFRSFLLLALKRYLARERDKSRARKRGGGLKPIALDSLTAEQRYALEPAEHLSADKLFERRWALTLLEQVLSRLRQEQQAAGQLGAFEQLKEFLLAGGRGTPYAGLAARLGTSEGAVKVAVHRLRQRYRHLLEEEIANTVTSREEAVEERRYLLAVLSR